MRNIVRKYLQRFNNKPKAITPRTVYTRKNMHNIIHIDCTKCGSPLSSEGFCPDCDDEELTDEEVDSLIAEDEEYRELNFSDDCCMFPWELEDDDNDTAV
jgi:hypothetical protein